MVKAAEAVVASPQPRLHVGPGSLLRGTKFHRLYSYRIANLHYLVVGDQVLQNHELPHVVIH
jgi:hypothetical protein